MALWVGGANKQTVSVPDLDERELVQIISFLRLGIGVGLFLFPRRAGRWWTGEEESSTTSRMAMRSVGGRDAALALGTLVALENDGNVRGWLEAGALADASDAASVITNWRSLPRLRRLLILASSISATVVGLNLAPAFDDDR
ncbi:MAG: hypothetical protein ACRDJL_04585 [Actinomycetota bacterium]